MNARKRKVFVIARRFQLSFILIQVVCIAGAFSLVYYAANSALLSMGPFMERAGGAPGAALARDFTVSVKLTILCAGLFVILMILFWGFFTLQKVAGPLYRLHKHMIEDATARRLSPVYFRKGDFFNELSETYNHLTERISSAGQPPAAGGPDPRPEKPAAE